MSRSLPSEPTVGNGGARRRRMREAPRGRRKGRRLVAAETEHHRCGLLVRSDQARSLRRLGRADEVVNGLGVDAEDRRELLVVSRADGRGARI